MASLLCAPATAQERKPPTADKAASAGDVAGWIKNLDDPRYRVREEATQRLLVTGAVALDPLLTAANSDRPEPADRAVWIMRRMARSRDSQLAVAALERLVKLQNHPAIVAKADAELDERNLKACEERLTPLGAEMASELEPIEGIVMPVMVVRLGEKWRGKPDDLRLLVQLRQLQHYRIEGAAVDDSYVRLFVDKEKLDYLQLRDTKVSPAVVDALKTKHADATIYVKNRARLGIAGGNHPAGCVVVQLVAGSAAEKAGIRVGDIVTTIDGHAVPDFDRLTGRVGQHQPGDKIEIEILRNNERIKLTPVLGERPADE
jgi:hypothetical protein